jgi:hypothetical protein
MLFPKRKILRDALFTGTEIETVFYGMSPDHLVVID